MTQQQRKFWAQRKRAEADSLMRLAERLNDITPRVRMAIYTPETEVLIDTVIRLQDEANQLEA